MIQTFYNAFLLYRTLALGNMKVESNHADVPTLSEDCHCISNAIMVFERYLVYFGIDALSRAINVVAELESNIL